MNIQSYEALRLQILLLLLSVLLGGFRAVSEKCAASRKEQCKNSSTSLQADLLNCQSE